MNQPKITARYIDGTYQNPSTENYLQNYGAGYAIVMEYSREISDYADFENEMRSESIKEVKKKIRKYVENLIETITEYLCK